MHESEFLPSDPIEEPATLMDENLSLFIGGVLRLVGNGGIDEFIPDADLDAALIEAYAKVMGV